MPFAPRPKVDSAYRNLGAIASERAGELVNCYFLSKPDAIRPGEIMVKKCLGYARRGTNVSLPGAVRGLGIGAYQPSTGSTGGIYAAWDNATPDIQIYLIGTGDPTSQGATARFSTNDVDVEFEQANDTLYVTNGIEAVIKMNTAGTWSALATGEPLSGASTVAKYLSWHNFMMWAARTVTAPNKLNISDSGTPETYSGNTKTFPYKIIGIKPLGDYQVIYTEKTVHTASGYVPSQIAFQEIINPHPCVSHRSIVSMNIPESVGTFGAGTLVHLYMGADYVWAFNGTQSEPVGKEGWDEIRSSLNASKLDLSAAYYDPVTRQYRVSVCTGSNTRNNLAYAYDFTSKKWIQLPGWSACAYATQGTPNPTTYWQESTALGLMSTAGSGNNITIPSNQLDGAIVATDTTITVDSTTGFASTGKIVIDNETIRYTGTSGTTFTGCIRGSDGTTAAAHSDNAAVYVAPKFEYTTVFLDDGDKNLLKKYKNGWCDLKASSTAYSVMVLQDVDQFGISLRKSIPLLTTGATWGSFVWGGANWGSASTVQAPNNRFPLSGRGQEHLLSFEESANIMQTEIYSIEYRWRPGKKK